MKTIGQQIKWNFKANGNLEIKDKNGKIIYYEGSNGHWGKWEWDSQYNEIYFETSSGYWVKREWDSQGNQIYFEDSKKYWVKCEYDSKGCCIYYVDSDGYWTKREYDSKGNIIYHENSYDIIIDNRPKPCEGKEIVIGGEKFKLVKV